MNPEAMLDLRNFLADMADEVQGLTVTDRGMAIMESGSVADFVIQYRNGTRVEVTMKVIS